MSRRSDSLLENLVQLQVRLRACRERLRAGTDSEGLHDLRIALRRLRSLLRPLRQQLPGALELDACAATLGAHSGALRDDEVLLAELQRHGCAELLPQLPNVLRQGHLRIAEDATLTRLLQLLDDWPEHWRELQRDGACRGLGGRVRRSLRRQVRGLRAALDDPQHDWHRLRLLAKRLRYADEAYPGLLDLPPAARQALRQAQSALGDWHDTLQWLARVERQPALAHMAGHWRSAQQGHAERALQAMQALRLALPEAA